MRVRWFPSTRFSSLNVKLISIGLIVFAVFVTASDLCADLLRTWPASCSQAVATTLYECSFLHHPSSFLPGTVERAPVAKALDRAREI